MLCFQPTAYAHQLHEFKGRKVLEESFVQLLLFVSKTDAGALFDNDRNLHDVMTANRMFQ